MTATCVIGTISGHRANPLVLTNLAEQLGQDRAVAIAAGSELDCPDVRGGRVYGEMHFTSLASALQAVLASLPFPVAEELDACAIDKQAEWFTDTGSEQPRSSVYDTGC